MVPGEDLVLHLDACALFPYSFKFTPLGQPQLQILLHTCSTVWAIIACFPNISSFIRVLRKLRVELKNTCVNNIAILTQKYAYSQIIRQDFKTKLRYTILSYFSGFQAHAGLSYPRIHVVQFSHFQDQLSTTVIFFFLQFFLTAHETFIYKIYIELVVSTRTYQYYLVVKFSYVSSGFQLILY